MDQSGTSPPEALPKWLTEEYFRSLFRRKSPGEEVAVQNVTVKFADEERVHGRLIRVAVDVATPAGAKTLSYIVKRPAPGHFSSTPASANMYRMEALVLGEIIPAMEKVLEAVAPGKFGQLAPRLVDYGLDENRFIMTEDLSVGFSTGNRQIGLDLEHSLAYVNHLAAFHAASVAVMDRYESEIKAIPLLIDSEEVKFLNEFIATSMKGVESVIDSWEEGSKYAHQVRKLGASLPSRLAHANRAGEGLAVLCHGDMFVNNILFRGGAGGPAVRLVDFQLSRVGSFADDLAGFLVSAVDDDVLGRHWERVGEQYREALNAALLALGHGARALSQEAVRDAMRAQRAVAQFALFHMLPRSRAPAAVHLHAAGPAFHAPAYRALLALLLPRFRALGWLDEFHNAAVNHENRIPSWPTTSDYFQLLLQQQSTGADLRVEGVHVTKPKGKSTSTTDFFQAAVEIPNSSGVETKCFVLRCPGNVVFAKMPAKSCMLEMEIPVLGKQISAAEKSTASGIKSSQTRSPLDQTENSRSYTHKRIQVKTVFHHKSTDLKFCLAVIHLLALLHVASMIATGGNNSKISDIATSHVPKEYITTSIKTIFPHLATLQTEQKEKENGPSETRDERVLLDSQEAIVKSDEIQLDAQKTTQEHSAEKERKLNAVANERIRRDSHSSKYRLNEGEQRHEQDVSKFNNIGHKINKTISRASYVNELSYPAERVDARGNTTELSEESFKSIPRLSDLTSSYQERREDLQSRLGAPFPVDRISFFRVPPQASPSKEVDSRNTKNSSVVPIKFGVGATFGALCTQLCSVFLSTSCSTPASTPAALCNLNIIGNDFAVLI